MSHTSSHNKMSCFKCDDKIHTHTFTRTLMYTVCANERDASKTDFCQCMASNTRNEMTQNRSIGSGCFCVCLCEKCLCRLSTSDLIRSWLMNYKTNFISPQEPDTHTCTRATVFLVQTFEPTLSPQSHHFRRTHNTRHQINHMRVFVIS